MSDNQLRETAEPVVAVGHQQRMALLYATVATNQARYRDQRLADAVAQAEEAGPEAVQELLGKTAAMQHAAEDRLRNIEHANPAGQVAMLADALLWQSNSPIAATTLATMREQFARQGVRIDPDTFQAGVDPDFDAGYAQRVADAQRVKERASAVVGIVAAMPWTEHANAKVAQAVLNWYSQADEPTRTVKRREQLTTELAAAPISESDRARVEFVVDYLSGDTTGVDLLASPVFVDPGDEARGRVKRLLETFEASPSAAPFVTESIAVMSAADQDIVRRAGRDIAAGRESAESFAAWPEHVDRYELGAAIGDYAADMGQMREVADALAQGEIDQVERLGAVVTSATMTVTDDVHGEIGRLAEARSTIGVAITGGQGLTDMERAQLTSTLQDIDAGRITNRKGLPELLFADERSKADADVERVARAASELSTATTTALTERIEATGQIKLDHRTREGQRVRDAVSSLGDSVYSVACGARGDGIERERKFFTERRDRLDQALDNAQVGPPVRAQVHEVVRDNARQAGTLGKAAAAREQQWKHKVAQVVAARDDQLAQRRAASAGRSSAGQASGPRLEQASEEAHAPRHTAIGRRQLHSPELGR